MKKNLIALAVLAASGAAFAQSSVTVYGTVDEAFAHTTASGAQSQNLLVSGGVSTSNFGFKGTEDLGGGLKANFKLEQGINVDTGAQGTAGLAFNRYSYVSLSGGFGEIKFGKTGTAYDDISGAADAAFNANALGLVANLFDSHTGYNWNPANSIYYATPEMSGFSGAFSYTLGENKTAAADAGSTSSIHIKYAAGPVFAGFAYQTEKATGNALSQEFTRLNGSYDLKVAKVQVAYGRVANAGLVSGAEVTEWEIGADYPVSSALTLSGGFARSSDNVLAGDQTRKGYTLAAAYSLSKRTTAYAGYLSTKTNQAGVADTDASVLAFGVKHTF